RFRAEGPPRELLRKGCQELACFRWPAAGSRIYSIRASFFTQVVIEPLVMDLPFKSPAPPPDRSPFITDPYATNDKLIVKLRNQLVYRHTTFNGHMSP
ncbi:unnamed protein product, partial [Nesidiocoris tenuis]